jgi:hypothetical protein
VFAIGALLRSADSRASAQRHVSRWPVRRGGWLAVACYRSSPVQQQLYAML